MYQFSEQLQESTYKVMSRHTNGSLYILMKVCAILRNSEHISHHFQQPNGKLCRLNKLPAMFFPPVKVHVISLQICKQLCSIHSPPQKTKLKIK